MRDLYGGGGVNNAASNWAKHVSALGGVDFYVLSHRIDKDMPWIKQHFYMPAPVGLPIIGDLELPLAVRRSFKEAVDAVKPDVIHVHTTTMFPPAGVPALSTVHGTYQKELPYLMKHPVSPFYKTFGLAYTYSIYYLEKFGLRYFDHYHVPSMVDREELMGFGIKDERISVVPNGVEQDEFKPSDPPAGLREKYGLPGDGKIVLSVGTINPRKGAHVVVRAARRVLDAHPDAEFVFIGPIPRLGRGYMERMYADARAMGVPGDKLHFAGSVPKEDLIGFYNACSVFVSGSYHEGFGLNILEAAACGKSIVTTEVGAARDIVGDLGTVVRVNDAPAMAEGIVRALDAGKMAVPGLRARVEQKYAWDTISKDLLSVYERTAGMK